MKRITVTLTAWQAEQTIQALEWAQDNENPGQSAHNAFLQRIINQIKKKYELAQS